MSTTGTLKLHILEARLTRDTEDFGKMDPYCVINTRMQRFRTHTIDDVGKNPVWSNEVFDIDVKYIGDDMHIEVFDEDPCKSDLIGEANVKLSAMCINGGLDEWFELGYCGKKAGSVHLKGHWHPKQEMLVQIPVGQVMPIP